MERIKKTPNQVKIVDALEKDIFTNIELKNTTKPLIEYDLVEVINQQNQFEKERVDVRKYRFSGKINVITANELTPTTQTVQQNGAITVDVGALNEDWDPLFDGNPEVSPNNWVLQILYPFKKLDKFDIEFVDLVGNIYSSTADSGPQISGYTPSVPAGKEKKVGLELIQKHNLIVGDYIYVYSRAPLQTPYVGIQKVETLGIDGKNLDKKLTLDVPYDDTAATPKISHYRKIVGVSENDITFKNANTVTSITATDVNGGTFGVFSSIDEIHTKIQTQEITSGDGGSYRVGDFIDLRGVGIINGIFKITAIIDIFSFTIKLVFSSVKGQTQTYTTNNPMLRVLDGTPSEYYVREFKVLSTNDYDVYDCAFSSSIYPKTLINELGIANKTWLYHFNKDINVKDLVDCNNKPLTNLYLGFIKRSGENTFPWSDVVAGWDFNSENIGSPPLTDIDLISKYVVGGVGTIEKPNENFSYIGDYSEYNSKEIKERVISKVVHRFTKQGDSTGYYLDPFKELKIMVFSDVIETSSLEEPVEGIPNYAEVYPDESIAWRDLLNIGYLEPENENGVNYPFVNGRHYFYGNYYFFIRRQVIPKETIIDQENITVGEIQDVC